MLISLISAASLCSVLSIKSELFDTIFTKVCSCSLKISLNISLTAFKIIVFALRFVIPNVLNKLLQKRFYEMSVFQQKKKKLKSSQKTCYFYGTN